MIAWICSHKREWRQWYFHNRAEWPWGATPFLKEVVIFPGGGRYVLPYYTPESIQKEVEAQLIHMKRMRPDEYIQSLYPCVTPFLASLTR